MERLKQLAEKLNHLTHDGASKDVILEVTLSIIRELMVVEMPTQTEKHVEDKKAVVPESQTIAGQSLNDRFNSTMPALSDRLQQLRQDSMRTAMGINDRYIYLDTLFKGDAQIFDNMMQLLDQATTFNEAETVATQYISTVQDNVEQAAVVEKFYDLLRSRFSSM